MRGVFTRSKRTKQRKKVSQIALTAYWLTMRTRNASIHSVKWKRIMLLHGRRVATRRKRTVKCSASIIIASRGTADWLGRRSAITAKWRKCKFAVIEGGGEFKCKMENGKCAVPLGCRYNFHSTFYIYILHSNRRPGENRPEKGVFSEANCKSVAK